jgi:hypothetical protein
MTQPAYPEVVLPPARFEQGVDELRDYTNDFSAWLPVGDSIITSSWTSDTGLQLSQPSSTATSTTIWIGPGGLPAYAYRVVNHVITSGSRQFDRKFWIKIKEH